MREGSKIKKKYKKVKIEKSEKSDFWSFFDQKSIFFQKMSRTSNYKFNSIKLCFFKLKKNISEHFWKIFQILIWDLVWVVNVVNIQKNAIWAQILFFFKFSLKIRISRVILPYPWIGFVKIYPESKNLEFIPRISKSRSLCLGCPLYPKGVI